MKKTIISSTIFLTLCVALFTPSCKETDELPKVSISINTKFGNEDFVTLKNYDFSGTGQIKFNNFQFFLSNMVLEEGTRTEKLAEVLFVDGNKGSNVNLVTDVQLPIGNYTKLRFGLGVDSVTNKQTPANFPSSNPLSNSNWYWSDWASFTFMKVEGPFAQTAFPQGFSYHTSRNVMYREVELLVNYDAKVNESTKKISLKLDLKKLFINGSDTININQLPIAHGEPLDASKTARSTKIANNFQTAWSVSN